MFNTKRLWILIGFIIFLKVLLVSPLWGSGAVHLPKTGQTKCYDSAGSEISCLGTGQDGEWQAGAVWSSPRFRDNGDGTITDSLTGLMWAKDAGTPTVGLCMGGAKEWQEALEYVTCLNSLNYLDYNDWRLPNINELESLIHSGLDNYNWLTSQGFTNLKNVYWSSTSREQYHGWRLELTGKIEAFLKAVPYFVWPVRTGGFGVIQLPRTGQTLKYADGDDGDLKKGVQWPSPRFKEEGDCIIDNLTGLMWVKSTEETQRSWLEALDYANQLSLCGYNDWRLPNRKELRSLINYGALYPDVWLDDQGFSILSSSYFSSTTFNNDTTNAWEINYSSWGSLIYTLKSNKRYSLPVRGGEKRLYMAVKGSTNNNIYLRYKLDGNWSPWQKLSGATSHAPAMASFNGKLYIVVKGATNNNIYFNSMDSSGVWGTWKGISGQTVRSPALAVFNNRLYLFVKGATNNNIYYCSMDPSETWSSWNVVPGGTTSHSPALLASGEDLFLFVKGSTNNNLYINRMDSSGGWSEWQKFDGGTTSEAPALVGYNGYGYLFVKGATNNNIYYIREGWSSWQVLSGTTTKTPSLASNPQDGLLYIAVKGATNNNIYYRTMDTSGNWSPSWITMDGATSESPVLAVY